MDALKKDSLKRKPGVQRQQAREGEIVARDFARSKQEKSSPAGAIASAPYRLKPARANRKFYGIVFFFCIVPTIVTFVYFAVFATPFYKTTFIATYQSYAPPSNLSTAPSTGLFGSASSAVDLSSIIYNYVRSPAMLERLQKKLNLRKEFSSNKIDYFSRLSKDASFGTFLGYYRSVVTVTQGMGGFVDVSVESPDPKYSSALAQEVIAACDDMLKQLTGSARSDEVRTAQLQLQENKKELVDARSALAKFQNQYGMIDPQASASQLSDIIAKLETIIATKKAEMAAQSKLTPNSPQLQSMKDEIASLKSQISDITSRIATNGSDKQIMSDLIRQYTALKTQEEVAKADYVAASQGMATATANAAAKDTYFVVFAPPATPVSAASDETFNRTIETFGSSAILLIVISLLFGAFSDRLGTSSSANDSDFI